MKVQKNAWAVGKLLCICQFVLRKKIPDPAKGINCSEVTAIWTRIDGPVNQPPPIAYWRILLGWRIYTPDGSEAEMCGTESAVSQNMYMIIKMDG